MVEMVFALLLLQDHKIVVKKQPHFALRRPCRNTDLGKIKAQSAKRLWKTRVWQEVLKLTT